MDILNKNFKTRFIVFTLCFTLIFSSINYRKSYADGGIISLPVLAIVSTLAVGTGIALNNIDDIYDIGRIFYDYVQSNNKITWDVVKTTFESAKVINGMISVDKNILDICKDFFDSFFDFKGNSVSSVGTLCGIPVLQGVDYTNFNKYSHLAMSLYDGTKIGNIDTARINSSGFMELGKSFVQSLPLSDVGGYKIFMDGKTIYDRIYFFYKNGSSWQWYGSSGFSLLYSGVIGSYVDIPYNGTYDWGTNVGYDVNDLPLPIPGNLGDLVGKSPSDIWSGSYDSGLVGNGDLSIPNIDNPSIGIGGSTSFPNTDTGVGNPSLPGVSDDINTGIWATIKDFVVSLVVPSDTFWTDTWNGLYGSFVSAFPGVDMDNFNSLVTGEKKFPNIDINIMGVKGRVVNGDVINSIVDWLRPIIAGFMMLCLMFFNYRKIYKLIRNSEPFGGIAPGTSDFSTGISEYSDNYLKAKEIIGENLRVMVSKGGK